MRYVGGDGGGGDVCLLQSFAVHSLHTVCTRQQRDRDNVPQLGLRK